MFIGFYETTSVASGLHLNSTILPQKLAENALGLVKFLPQTRRKSTPLFRAHKMERMSLGCVDWRSARTSTLEMWTCSGFGWVIGVLRDLLQNYRCNIHNFTPHSRRQIQGILFAAF
jgi:hypothetical protein